MTDTFWDFCASGLVLAIIAAWRSVPLLGVVLLIDLFLGRRIPPRFQCTLWLLVIVRLVLPFSVESPLSVTKVADSAISSFSDFVMPYIPSFDVATYDQNVVASGEFEVVTLTLNSGNKVTVPVLPEDASKDTRQQAEDYAAKVHEQRMKLEANPPPAKIEVPSVDWEERLIYTLGAIWMVGAVGLTLTGLSTYCRFAWRLRRCPQATDTVLQERVRLVCKDLGLGKLPKVKLVESLSAPAVFGIWIPVLCLPKKSSVALSENEWTWVLRHELAHIKRRDAFVLAIAVFIRSLQWFNPMAWFALSKLKSSIELAADDVATRGMEPSTIVEYGRLLLRYATRDSQSDQPAVVGLLSMASGKSIRRRVERLGIFNRNCHWLVRWISFAAIAFIGMSGLTDAMTTRNGWVVFGVGDQSQEESRGDSIQEFLHVDFRPAESGEANLSLLEAPKIEEKHAVEIKVELALKNAKLIMPELDENSFVRDSLKIDDPVAKIVDGILTASMTSSVEKACRQTISTFELIFQKQISLTVRKIRADVALGARFQWDVLESAATEMPVNLGSTPTITTKLSEIESLLFIHRCRNSVTSNILYAPKVTMFDGQFAEIADVMTTPLATRVQFVPGDLARAISPVIEDVEAGMKMQCRLFAQEDDAVELDFTIIESKLNSVREGTLPIKWLSDPKKFVTVQVPVLSTNKISTRVRLSKNESLLIACATDGRDEGSSDKSQGAAQSKNQENATANFYLLSPEVLREIVTVEGVEPRGP